MRRFDFLLYGVATAAILTVGGQAMAQTAKVASSTDALEEVVVTGRAGSAEQRRANVSYAITTLSADRLRLSAPVSTAEVFKSVPGFWVESTGGEASNNVRSRGIPTDGYSSVTIQEDGLTIQHDGGLGYLNADQSFRLDETIGKVEAVRGGPASIFASNAPGGIVNFITKKPGDKAEGIAKIEGGDYGRFRGDFYYGAPIANGWAVSVGGFYRADDGVRTPGFTQNQGGQIRAGLSREFAGGQFSINVKHIDDKVGFLLPVPLTFDGKGEVTGVPGFDPNYGTLAGPDTQTMTFRNVNGPYAWDLTRGTDLNLTQVTANLDLDIGAGWTLKNIGRYRTSETLRNGLFPTGSVDTATSRIASYLGSARALYPTATGVIFRYAASGQSFDPVNQNGNGLVINGNLLSVQVPHDEFADDLRLTRKFNLGGQTHDVAFGGYFAKYNYKFIRYMSTALLEVRDQARRLDALAVNASGAVVGSITENGILRYGSLFDNAAVDDRAWAFYASDEWQITPALRLDAGLRHDSVKYTGTVEGKQTVDLGVPGTFADNQVITGTGQFTPINRNFSNTSFTFGANYQLMDRLGVFARYTDTARIPSSSDFQGSPGDALRTDAPITPIQMAEGGVKFQSDMIDIFATAFWTRYKNLRFTDNVFDNKTLTFVTRSAFGGTQTPGVELETVVRPVNWFDVTLNASYQDPQYRDFVFTENVGGQPVQRSFSGKQLIRVPKTSLRAIPGVNLLGDSVRAELVVEYFSLRYADTANSQSLPDYTMLGVNLRWNVSDRIGLSANATNLTNEIGLTEGNPRAGQFVSGDAGAKYFTARPEFGRTFRVAASYRF